MFIWIVLGVIAFVLLAVLITSYICFYKIFLAHRPKSVPEYPIPEGRIYEVYREQMIAWIKQIRALPHRDVEIKSFDGLTLRGRFYECTPGAPIELMLHGYRGDSERDLSGGVDRAFKLGHSVLLVDHRGSGRSDGKIITFGINERRDCAAWVDFILREIDPNAKIMLTGVSMGAATVMIASADEYPENVVGVLADCGYTSARAIIKKVIRDMKLPPNILYPFARLGGRLFGHFDIDETSPIEAMKSSRIPVIFFHGDDDDFVPHYMSVENYDACISENKKMVTIEGAGHGLAYVANPEKYLKELKDFCDSISFN